MHGAQWWNASTKVEQHCWTERLFGWRFGMICHYKSSLSDIKTIISRQDFDGVLLQLILTLWTPCLTTEWADIHQCNVCTVGEELQLHVHLKNWALKFKLLYQLNYISCFNKICTLCQECEPNLLDDHSVATLLAGAAGASVLAGATSVSLSSKNMHATFAEI